MGTIILTDFEPTEDDLSFARATVTEDVVTTGSTDRTVDRMIRQLDSIGSAYAAGDIKRLISSVRRSRALLVAFREHRAAMGAESGAQA